MARKTGSDGQTTARHLRAAAERLFSRHGYGAVSMRQIAREIGVQAGTLYLYTPDKQALLSDLMVAHLQELLQEWRKVSEAIGKDPRARLEAFVRLHITFHLARPDAVFIAYMELRSLEPANFQRIEALRHGYEDELEQILIAGMSSGQFRRQDSRLATFGLIAMLTGVTTWYRKGGRLGPEAIADVYADMALHAVVADQQPPR